ncbi:MAG TPA: Ku protein [Polyangiaceae bacterium]|jgi:DNA end-binding protein Ku|nr:Ku protein [Polyangiaceae bacterium]
MSRGVANHRKASARSQPRSRKKPLAAANETGTSARAVWTGSIGFGLVQIPVRVQARERTNDLAFHQVDRRDHAPIGYERVNKDTGKPVEWSNIARAYEIQKGQMVIVDDQDFEKANVTASHTIEIQDFVDASTIPAAFFDRPYLVLPDKRGQKAYVVLRDVLREKALAAVGLVVLRTRQHLCAVTVEGDLLSLELLRFAHELRPAREVAPRGLDGGASKPSAKELALAEQLIERMVVDWDPTRYKDTYRDDLLAAIRRKAEKGSLEPQHVPAAEPRARPIDLASLLEKSVANAKKKRARRAA